MKKEPSTATREIATGWDGRVRGRPGFLAALGIVLTFSALVAWVPPLAGESHEESKKKKCNLSTRDCVDQMSKMFKATGWVGVELKADEETGIHTIEKVIAGSPAEEAGLEPGDVLRSINGLPIAEFRRKILASWGKANYKSGQSVTYLIERGGLDRRLEIKLAPMPAERDQAGADARRSPG
jgi:predicted metalloprotease with PDZ domain